LDPADLAKLKLSFAAPDAEFGTTEVYHPDHYTQGIECLDYIMSHDMNPAQANCIKYLTRYKHKGSPLKDLLKCKFYLHYLIKQEIAREELGMNDVS
jgi:hypothetical protein